MTTPSILVIGSLNADLISTTSRLPAAGETLHARSFHTAPGGKGANQALACARLSRAPSHNVRMLGAVGTDSFGPMLTSTLAASGVDVSGVATVAGATGTAVIIVDESSGENRILIHAGANGTVGAPTQLGDAAAVVLQLEIPVATVLAVLQRARAAGVATVFNPAPAVALPESVWPDVDWLVVNETEAAILTGVDVSALDEKDGVERAAKAFLERGVGAVVVTLGGRGCYWATKVGEHGWEAVSVRKEDVVDTTGAGDTFVGGLTVAVVEGRSAAESVLFASKASASAVQKSGAMAGVPWRREIE